MIRELLATAAITGVAIGLAPCAAAYEGDVPGMNYQASLGAPCDNYERFIFGRGPSGQAEACHFPPPNQFPAATTGYWVISYPLFGVQQNGAPCPGPQTAAQTPDGLPMLCLGAQGWQPGWFTGAGFFPPSGYTPAYPEIYEPCSHLFAPVRRWEGLCSSHPISAQKRTGANRCGRGPKSDSTGAQTGALTRRGLAPACLPRSAAKPSRHHGATTRQHARSSRDSTPCRPAS